MHSAVADAERINSVRGALTGLSLSMLLSSLGTSIANVALPTLARAFNASFQDVQWIVLAYLLAITTLIVSVGRLGDITGRRRLLLAGIVLFTIASVLCGAASTLWLLIAARAAQGLGAAMMMALTMAFVGETVPKARIGSAMGLLGTMSAIGTALGPSLGGVLIAALGWQAIFLVNVPLGVLAFVLAYRYLPIDRREQKTNQASFDVLGTLLLALTLGTYALAMTFGRGSFGSLNLVLLLIAAFGVALFVFAETRAASPLIRLAMFRDLSLSASLIISALVATVMMATLVVGPFYLSRTLQLDAALVGLVMSIGPIISALSGVLAGRIVDRWGAPFMVIVGLIAMAGGSVALSVLPAVFGIAGYIVAIAVLTPGYALFQAANNTAVMMDVQPNQRGVISGLLNLSRHLGFIAGASLMGAVFALASAATDITTASPEAVATGMRITFAVAGGLIVIALAIAIGSRGRATPCKSEPIIGNVKAAPSSHPGNSGSRPPPSLRASPKGDVGHPGCALPCEEDPPAMTGFPQYRRMHHACPTPSLRAADESSDTPR
jgi:EmrB/QacA subfamily drug resistance transporter